MARRPKTWPIFVPWAEGPLDTEERVRNLAWAIEFNRRATTPGMTEDTLRDAAMVLWVDTVFRFEELLQNIGHGLPYDAVEAAIPAAAREMFEREVAGLSDGAAE